MISKSFLFLAAVLVLCSAQEQRPGQLAHDLSFSLSISIVAIAVVIMIIVSVVLLHRAKKGYFCCLKPRIRYPEVRGKRTVRASSRDPEAATNPAPTYEVHPRGADIAPPDYEDALQDAVINAEQAETNTDNIGDDSTSVDIDDQTPLNP